MPTVLILENPDLAAPYAERLSWSGITVITELPLRLDRQTLYLTDHGDYSNPAKEVLTKIREITRSGDVDFIIVGWEGWEEKVAAIDQSMVDRTVVVSFDLYPRGLFLQAGITRIVNQDKILPYLDEVAA